MRDATAPDSDASRHPALWETTVVLCSPPSRLFHRHAAGERRQPFIGQSQATPMELAAFTPSLSF